MILIPGGYKQGALNPGAVEGEISGTALTRKGKEAKGDLVKHAGDVFKLAAEGDEACQKLLKNLLMVSQLYSQMLHIQLIHIVLF